MTTERRIGPVGTSLRVLVGLGVLYLAGAVDGLPWDVDWYDPLVGFVALPAIALAMGSLPAALSPGRSGSTVGSASRSTAP
jgi:hypothetical protein